MDDGWLSPGLFARRSRLSPKALRLYAGNGILVPQHVDPSSGYRRYHVHQLLDARLVHLLRRAGMPLALVARVLAAPRETRPAIIAQFREHTEHEMAQRLRLITHLTHSLTGGKDRYPMYDIATRDVPDQVVLTEQAHVTATGLSDWIATTGLRQLTTASSVGGQVGPSMVIYHGEVSEDSDGPVESCIPVNAAAATEPTIPVRTEPAHREVFTRVTRAQIRYPDLLSAYDALEQWIGDHRVVVTGPPRELYFGDPSTGPDDEFIADVAIPIER